MEQQVKILWCQYPTGTLVRILAALFLIQFPATALGKQWKVIQLLGLLPPTWEPETEFQGTDFGWLSLTCCDHLRIEPETEDISDPVFQTSKINIYLKTNYLKIILNQLLINC